MREWRGIACDPDLEALAGEIKTAPRHRLSGLGPGLTPAGDDFITGWASAVVMADTAGARTQIGFFLKNWRPGKTTWFSKWMIIDALDGKIWKRGKDLISALAEDDAERLTNAAGKITGWGHTSGRAWLCGFASGYLEPGM